MKKSDFNYLLPDALIAQKPLAERDASRLLCMNRDTGKIADRQFTDFIDLISERVLLVFNDTKVIPARLFGKNKAAARSRFLSSAFRMSITPLLMLEPVNRQKPVLC